MSASRVDTIRDQLDGIGVDTLLVGQPSNRQYLSGFMSHDQTPAATAGWLIINRREAIFVSSPLYADAIRQSVRGFEVVTTSSVTQKMIELLGETIKRVSPKKLGFEGAWLTVNLHAELAKQIDGACELVAIDGEAKGPIERMREIKDAGAVAAIRRSIDLTDRAYESVVRALRPGVTEREVAWRLESAMREMGAEGMAFGPSVAAGPNAAVPHHDSSDRPIRAGEPVWIDMGSRLDGYCADLTRSFCLERADERFRTLYDLVLRAQEAALKGLRPGLTGKEGDALARDVIEAAGHGAAFNHGLGHGLGLQIHEAPRVSKTSEDTLASGMVVTVEPGVYFPGWGGIRIEDVVVIRDGAVENLTHAPKQPVV